MLYSEFLKGTRAPETPDTYDQFQIIGQIYEDCEGMTKEEAFELGELGEIEMDFTFDDFKYLKSIS